MNRTPYTKKDFAWTKWTARKIRGLVPGVITAKKSRLAKLKKIPKLDRTFENTVYALTESDDVIRDTILKIDLLKNVSPEKNIREEAKKFGDSIEKKLIALARDSAVWRALKDYERGAWQKERATLAPEDKKLFKDIFLEYKRMGFDLTKAKQNRLKSIEQKLAKLGNDFLHRINGYKDHILASEEEMAGLPERYKQSLKKDYKGRYIITLTYPDYHPFMELAENDAKRKKLAEKNLQKGGMENMQILREILSLRAEHATLLNYKNHADYKTELRMAKSGATALSFVRSLLKKVLRGGREDLALLRAEKEKTTKNPKTEIGFHDIAYYGELLQKRRYKLSSEELRAYFPLARVLSGSFKIYETLFGVKFKKLKNFPMWHPDVTLYAVKMPSGEILSYFALDLHPREGKYSHAAAFGTITGRANTYRGADYIPPFAAMVTNFTKPSKTHPSLLSHGEVETFLHEFGHIMHLVLTRARHGEQSGYNTKRDFVEAPSQMLENWAWNRKALKLLSGHFKTRKSLPYKLEKNLIASKRYMLCYQSLRQLILALFDITLHTTNKPLEPAKLYRDLVKKYTNIALPKNAIFPAGFGHLCGGYGAGYYGYMWSKVYAADMFTRFKREGVFNTKTGEDYKKCILETGGSREEIEIVKDFLGRKPNNKAFLKEIGL